MAHVPDPGTMSPEEKQFREFLTRGDDFCKIELYRHAVGWYRKAVDLRPGDNEARQRLEGCSAKIRQEQRVIAVLALVAVVIVMSVILFRCV